MTNQPTNPKRLPTTLAILLAAAGLAIPPTLADTAPVSNPIGDGSWLSGSWTTDTKGTDITVGYDDAIQRMDATLLANPSPSQAEIAAAVPLALSQVGNVHGQATITVKADPVSGGRSGQQLAGMFLTPGAGWFLHNHRAPGAAQDASTTNPVAWQGLSSDERVQVDVASACGTLSADVLRPNAQPGAVHAQLQVTPAGLDQGTGTDKFRNENLELKVTGPVPDADQQEAACTYTVTIQWSLLFVFEYEGRGLLSLRQANFYDGTHDANLNAVLTFSASLAEDGVSPVQPVATKTLDPVPFTVLYAPVVPIRWTCDSFQAQSSNDACATTGLRTASLEPVASVFRSQTGTATVILVTQVVSGVAEGAYHSVPDTGDSDPSTSSLLVKLAGTGSLVTSPWQV